MSTARVDFTRGAAERIARVVRIVETGERDQAPLTFRKVDTGGGGGAAAFRICTFTGTWPKETTKVVTYKFQTATPNTAIAMNLFADISVDCGERDCAIAREGTAWFLISAECG